MYASNESLLMSFSTFIDWTASSSEQIAVIKGLFIELLEVDWLLFFSDSIKSDIRVWFGGRDGIILFECLVDIGI